MGISNIPTTIFFNIAPNFFNSTGYRFFDFTIFKNFVMQIYEQYIHRFILRDIRVQYIFIQTIGLPNQTFYPVTFHGSLETPLRNTPAIRAGKSFSPLGITGLPLVTDKTRNYTPRIKVPRIPPSGITVLPCKTCILSFHPYTSANIQKMDIV